jgi:hypothetical protein
MLLYNDIPALYELFRNFSQLFSEETQIKVVNIPTKKDKNTNK